MAACSSFNLSRNREFFPSLQTTTAFVRTLLFQDRRQPRRPRPGALPCVSNRSRALHESMPIGLLFDCGSRRVRYPSGDTVSSTDGREQAVIAVASSSQRLEPPRTHPPTAFVRLLSPLESSACAIHGRVNLGDSPVVHCIVLCTRAGTNDVYKA